MHAERLTTVKLTDVVPPIRFESGVADIPQSYIESLRKVLDELRDRRNVRLHLVGHADDQPLSDALARVYGDNAGLSRERAGEVAEFLQTRLDSAGRRRSRTNGPATTQADRDECDAGRPRAESARRSARSGTTRCRRRMAEEEVLVKEDFKRIKVCRMETVCKMRFKEGHARRARIRNLVPPLLYEESAGGLGGVRRARPAGAGQSAGQAERHGQVHRLHRQRAADRAQRAHLRQSPGAVEGARASRGAGDAGSARVCRRRRSSATGAVRACRSRPTTPRRGAR